MPFTDPELSNLLADLPGWSLEDGQITKTFAFDSYAHAVLFVAACAHLAEKRDHHPDLVLTWRRVKVLLSTHSEGGVTDKDVNMAKEFEALAGLS